MSCDAKAWPLDSHGILWAGVCDASDEPTPDGAGLVEVLEELECRTGRMRWELFMYPDGMGLRGWVL